MKVQGGIKGIANKLSSLNKHFLIMPELKNIIEQSNSLFGIKTNKRVEHYQLTGGTQQRIATNVKKLKDIFVLHEITFEESEQVYNIITKVVLD